MFQDKLVNKASYKTRISAIYLKARKLQESDSMTPKIRVVELHKGWQNLEKVIYH